VTQHLQIDEAITEPGERRSQHNHQPQHSSYLQFLCHYIRSFGRSLATTRFLFRLCLERRLNC
jgi:hypothetical protein